MRDLWQRKDVGKCAPLLDALAHSVGRVNINAQCQRGPDSFPFTGRKSSALGTLSVSEALKMVSIESVTATKDDKGGAQTLPEKVVLTMRSHFAKGALVEQLLAFSLGQPHVMVPTRSRLLLSLFSLLLKGVHAVNEYNAGHPDFPMADDHLDKYVGKWLLFSLLWGFGGSMDYEHRLKLLQS